MKYYLVILSAFFLILTSCAGYKSKMQKAAITFPEIGSIISTQGKILYTNTEQIGVPVWNKPLNVQVKKMPFNKATYHKYATYMEKASKINSIAYVDSLPYKPKYVHLQLANKITIATILNNDDNKELKTYLEHAASYKLVTSIQVALTEEMITNFVNAEMLLLEQDSLKNTYLVLVTNAQRKKMLFSELEVFGYEYASFCWGEDKYHNKKIKNLVVGDKSCPKETYKKAFKVKSDKSYLKF